MLTMPPPHLQNLRLTVMQKFALTALVLIVMNSPAERLPDLWMSDDT